MHTCYPSREIKTLIWEIEELALDTDLPYHGVPSQCSVSVHMPIQDIYHTGHS